MSILLTLYIAFAAIITTKWWYVEREDFKKPHERYTLTIFVFTLMPPILLLLWVKDVFVAICEWVWIDNWEYDRTIPQKNTPTHDEGGILCPNCICKRLMNLGLTSVKVTVDTSELI